MYVKKRRGLVALAAITASVALSGIGAGGAQAALPGACLGDSIAGQGSSLQAAAQASWTTKFKTNMSGGCTTGPTVSYTATSSGRCLNTWKADGVTPVNTAVHFCGTDDAPTTAQITNINTATNSKVLSIPVAQAAIAFVVNPPVGCTIHSATKAQLESVFRGATTTWTDLGGTGAACDTTVTRVVRADSSGTSYQLKHWFFTQNSAAVNGTETWADLQATATNTTWPGTVRPSTTGCLMAFPCGTGAAGSGGGDLVKTVGVSPHSIGYAALADVRSVYASTTYPTLKWLKVQSGLSTVDPSTNGLSETKANSNCTPQAGAYATTGGVLPATTTTTWADVYQVNASTTYPLCTLTWDTALSHYEPHWGTTGTALAQSVKDYLGYVVNTAGGQTDGLGVETDYAPLGTDVQEKATTGVAEITG